MSDPHPDNGGEFFAQFLDDYFAECDEHLTLVRRHLLALEEQAGRPEVDTALLDELFRSFHTLKGISAMVDLSGAEQLAHHMESYLRALRQKEARPGAEGVEALMAATMVLEQVIAARRGDEPPPAIDATVARLRALLTGDAPTAGPPAPPRTAGAGDRVAESEQKRVWRFEFIPTPALSERGVNVNSVRERLQEIGEIQQATPHVRGQGGIVFEFVVATGVEESTFAGWHEDNLTYTPVEETTPDTSR
ncbi:MAG TPA: Hpt domain-containing protein, partial [Pyrinomonadaceae bacterium]|nr:Hpt domain-containing protein [Pyrinomonadaceae bacterium]